MGRLIEGATGCSPYLTGLIETEGDWLRDAVDHDAPMFDLLDNLQQSSTISADLRQAKRRIALYVGLAELAHAQPILDGAAQLTRFADKAVHLAFEAAISVLQARGKLPDDLRWFVLAMGKMGAFELNYSSDIDLIVMLDDSDADMVTAQDWRSHMVRATRVALKTLSDTSLGGYVFRTDVRLRPDPSVTPICVNTSQALAYYESVGRTWERAAFIKARTCAGDISAGEQFLMQLHPFIWRKNLDFAAIEDAHDLRLAIRKKTQLPPRIVLQGHDIKLGRGGIREIEFFTQTRQLISGGRDRDLRDRETLSGLQSLTKAGWVDADVAGKLHDNYLIHRRVEHALQMVRDAQTQSMPSDPEKMDRIAAMHGMSLQNFEVQTLAALEETHALTEAFFDPPRSDDAVDETVFQDDPTENWLSYPALRSDRAVKLFNQVRPHIMAELSKAADPNDAMRQFDTFLKGLPAGVQVFSLFAVNPKLVDLLTDIVSTSPALASYLGTNARVLDSVIAGDFFADWPGQAGLKRDLVTKLSTTTDYESALITARAWKKEWHFRIGVHLLRVLIDPVTAMVQFTDLADAIVQTIVPVVADDFARKHGHISRSEWMVLGMGSMGARSLSADSDLDLMVIFDADPDVMSDGKRPLPARMYFARLTQSLITALSAPMPEGTLYEVDMRLRPSGKAGPVATRIEAFEAYQKDQAWTWEHLALTRARVVFGDMALSEKVEAVRCDVISNQSDPAKIQADFEDMQRRLAQEKPATGPWDMKSGPGGLMDIELFAQKTALIAGLEAISVTDQLGETHNELAQIYQKLASLKVLHTVLCRHNNRTLDLGLGGWITVDLHCGIKDLDALTTQVSQLRRTAVDLIRNAANN
ncbi:MAG: glutamine-synthetase adenylyltransferase [Planktomarina sp.]